MVDEARKRTKVFLDTYLTALNMKKDDGITVALFITAYGLPDYPLSRVFIDKAVFHIFSVEEAQTSAILDSDHYPLGYKESVPVTMMCIDQVGFTATKRIWDAEHEFRRICEENPTGSVRRITGSKPTPERLGSTWLWSITYAMDYVRGLT